jgi:hypothetical protein
LFLGYVDEAAMLRHSVMNHMSQKDWDFDTLTLQHTCCVFVSSRNGLESEEEKRANFSHIWPGLVLAMKSTTPKFGPLYLEYVKWGSVQLRLHCIERM